MNLFDKLDILVIVAALLVLGTFAALILYFKGSP